MAPLDTAEKMEAKAGEGQQRGPGPAAAPARPQLRAPGRGYDPFSCGVDNTDGEAGEHGHGQVLQ